MFMKKIWLLFSIIGSMLPLHGMQLQETGRALIPAFSSDDVQFKVEEGVLKTSKTLKNMMDDCGGPSSEPLFLGKSAESFNLILPLLESIYESKNGEDEEGEKNLLLQDQLSKKKTGEVAQIIELADFFNVQQIIGNGSYVLKGRIDSLCGQPQENLEGAIKSFLGSMEPLTRSTSKLVAGKIITNHPVKTWLFESCNISSKLTCHTTCIESVCFSPDGNYLATGSRGGTAKICDVKKGQCIRTSDFGESLGYVCFSPDGKCLVITLWNGEVKVWNIESDNCILTSDYGEYLLGVSFSPNSKYLVTRKDDETIKIWNIESGNCIHTLPLEEVFLGVRFSPDGKYFVSKGGTIKIWNIEYGNCIRTFDYGEDLEDVRFSPDGKYLVTRDGETIKIWNIESGNCIRTSDYGKNLKGVRFTPDGKYLITRYRGEVKMWNVGSGNCIHTLHLLHHGEDSIGVRFSSDGKCLVITPCNGGVKIWNLDTLSALEQYLSNGITLEEAVALRVFYENRDNNVFGCPGYLVKLLPENIKKNIQSFFYEKMSFYSRMMWRCKNVFSKVVGVM